VIVVYQTSTSHKIELIFQLNWQLGGITQGLLVKLFVHAFIGTLLQHIWTNIEADYLFESLITQVLSYEASTTCKINYFSILRILA
jgi:hypothetical protein